MTISSARSSFRVFTRSKQAKLRLFCFPHAGAGASPYFAWAKLFSPEIEVIGVQLPGRENRISEAPLSKLEDILTLLSTDIEPFLGLPFAFFGHSMGALIAFELACYLRREGRPQPFHLFISGRAAPHLPVRRLHELPTAELLEHVRSFSGTADEVLQSEEMQSLFLPLLRADFSVCANHIHRQEPPLSCPITAFGGDDDPTATPEMIRGWERQTTHAFNMHTLSGSHFFVLAAAREVVKIIDDQLHGAAVCGAGPEKLSPMFCKPSVVS
ncbi:MAG: alpha/beta fold hydrolase [Candidatus Sulfotelmatobacter sp.]|jgi:medium-chain acyl-[acyl-carrier-protein] hydrolase